MHYLQSIYPLSNFYLNLAKNLNEDFHSYDTYWQKIFTRLIILKKQKRFIKIIQ